MLYFELHFPLDSEFYGHKNIDELKPKKSRTVMFLDSDGDHLGMKAGIAIAAPVMQLPSSL